MFNGRRLRELMSDERPIADRLFIVPFFDHREQLRDDAASVDLRLGSRFAVAQRGRLTHINPLDSAGHPAARYEERHVPLGERIVVHPGHFVLATTLEWLRLPPNIGGYFVGKLTLGRFGLNVTTGAGVQPGFAGALTLELANSADVPIELVVGQLICQVFFHPVTGAAEAPAEQQAWSSSMCSKRPTFGMLKTRPLDEFLGIGPATPGTEETRP